MGSSSIRIIFFPQDRMMVPPLMPSAGVKTMGYFPPEISPDTGSITLTTGFRRKGFCRQPLDAVGPVIQIYHDGPAFPVQPGERPGMTDHARYLPPRRIGLGRREEAGDKDRRQTQDERDECEDNDDLQKGKTVLLHFTVSVASSLPQGDQDRVIPAWGHSGTSAILKTARSMEITIKPMTSPMNRIMTGSRRDMNRLTACFRLFS